MCVWVCGCVYTHIRMHIFLCVHVCVCKKTKRASTPPPPPQETHPSSSEPQASEAASQRLTEAAATGGTLARTADTAETARSASQGGCRCHSRLGIPLATDVIRKGNSWHILGATKINGREASKTSSPWSFLTSAPSASSFPSLLLFASFSHDFLLAF